MKIKLFLLLVLQTIFLCGCVKECTVYCNDPLPFTTVGYDTSELNKIVIIRFVADHAFDKPLDTYFFTPGWRYYYSHGDTIELDMNSTYQLPTYQYAVDDTINDWEVAMPANNRIYKITDITYGGDMTTKASPDKESHDCSYVRAHNNCSRTLMSYKVNGKEYDSYPGLFNMGIYLVK